MVVGGGDSGEVMVVIGVVMVVGGDGDSGEVMVVIGVVVVVVVMVVVGLW